MAIEFNIEGNPLVIEVKDYQIESGNYRLVTGYNKRAGWYLSIYDLQDNPILLGLTIPSEPQNLTWRYSRVTNKLFTGDIWVLNKPNKTTSNLESTNFGESGDWGLFYFTQAEMVDYGINKR